MELENRTTDLDEILAGDSWDTRYDLVLSKLFIVITNWATIYQYRGAPTQKWYKTGSAYEVKSLNRWPDFDETLCGESLNSN